MSLHYQTSMSEKDTASECIKDFYTFLRNFWDVLNADEYIDNWHIEYLCDQLQHYGKQIAHREKALPDLIINVSPGSSKSTIVSQMFPAWLWLHAPWAVIISSSYSQTLSTEHATKTKEIIKSDRFQGWFQSYFNGRYERKLKLTKDTERHYVNSFGGERFATATDGAVMGKHAHVILIDDAMNMKMSMSPVYRKKANKFSTAGLSTRKKDKTKVPTITVGQRLHEEDTTGYMIEKAKEKGKRINHVVLPATLTDSVKPKSLRKYYKDGMFDPARLPMEALEDQKVDLGSYGYSGQFKQSPFPDEGGKIQRSWFQFISNEQVNELRLTWDLWIDGAYTEKTKNDPSGLMTCAYDKTSNKLYIGNWSTKRFEMPHLVKYVKEKYSNDPRMTAKKTRTFIEPKASGHSLKQILSSETDFLVTLIESPLVGEGKEARLQTASPKVEAGQIVLVEGAWNEPFMDEICFFPNASHDEAVDCLGYSVGRYFNKKKRKGIKVRK